MAVEKYTILPFRFEHFNDKEMLLTNDVGEYIFVNNTDFEEFVNYKLDTKSDVFMDIASKQIATTDKIDDVIPMLSTKFRTKKSTLRNFTELHMVVPTLRCNSSCIYCQVKRNEKTDYSADMTKETAKNIVHIIFECPTNVIKIEFQGGDPSSDFEMVQYIIEEAEWINLRKRKSVEFIICTNITLLTPQMVRYLKKHHCQISTSLDGPKELHNTNRPLQDKTLDHHTIFENKLNMIRSIWGEQESVGALMTTSRYSLNHFSEIVDEYVRLGFNCISFRALNPYGFAKQYQDKIAYPIEQFIENYKEGLNYIIQLNKNGIFIMEGFATLLLKRILTPFSTGFVDLQSPAGVGISGAIYDFDGNVYVADEGRMMARMGNDIFKLGNVNTNTYQDIFNGEKLHSIIHQSNTECLPACSECVFQPYCGADPVRNLSEQGDIIGHRPTNEMCKKTKSIIKYIFELLKENDPDTIGVFWSWINIH